MPNTKQPFWAAMALAILIFAGAVTPPVGRAQTPRPTPTAPMAFEVASIRPNHSGEIRTSLMPYPEGRLVIENNSLKQLIRSAYGVKDFQLSGGPAWLDTEKFDITAKTEGPASRQELMRMLQTLLAERFELMFHRETKQLRVYNLVIAKRGEFGPDLKEAKSDEPKQQLFPVIGAAGRIKGQESSMQDLASYLTGFTGDDRLVLDKTGLTATYNLTLVWTPGPGQVRLPPGVSPEALQGNPDRPPADGPSLFTAVQEQLGLKLEPSKGPVEIMVIDHAAKPTEN